MSTILEDQIIGWREPRARCRAPLAGRVSRRGILRGLIILASIVAALVYFTTSSQSVALATGLIREATRTAAAASPQSDDTPSPVAVFVRPSARETRPLLP